MDSPLCSDEVNLGSVIAGKFRLDRVLGRGAMGVILAATDMTLGRRVAVKLILPHHAAEPELRGRFLREAQAMTRLMTEHVARVFEAGELEDGTLFLVMEYLEGRSVDRLVQTDGPLPAPEAVDLVLGALEAVNEAHELGLVHRDLKPANLFLAERRGKAPILKVLDFGIVKDSAAGAKLTATGSLPGTPAYMAPEQVTLRKDIIDARADVWALGITLFELLTGSVPWTGEMNVLLTRICTEATPRLRAARPDVAPELEAVVERCLAKRPEDRFANGAELAAALRDLQACGRLTCENEPVQNVATTVLAARRGRHATTVSNRRGGGSNGRVLRVITFGIAICTVVVSLVLAMQSRASRPRPAGAAEPLSKP
ncbi:MAG TPA: serine/threonine-protein kinase [Labilithrix sp.]|nr:serine/threonine-protein kinase [Labilithrix sp.]